jgi:cell division protein FtsB
MRILLAILIVLLCVLQYKLWFGDGGYRNVTLLKQRVEEQARENAILEQRNSQLQAEVEDLREGLDAVEERARSELGLIKEGEEFYQVIDQGESDTIPENNNDK